LSKIGLIQKSKKTNIVTVCFGRVIAKDSANIQSVKNEVVSLSSLAWSEHIKALKPLNEVIFERLMETRPQINVNDICSICRNYNIDEKRRNNKFRITSIGNDNTINVVDTLDHMTFKNIPIDNIILIKEYQEKWYYVQNGYIGNAMCWWALDSKGYTTDITKAHKFTYDEAFSILKSNEKDNRRNEKVWSCDYIDNSEKAKKLIIDSQYLEDIDNSENQLKLK
jgi:hypothetical protein